MARRKISVTLEFEGEPNTTTLEEILDDLEDYIHNQDDEYFNVYADITEDVEVE